MTEYKCDVCNKIFDSEDAFNQHNQAKHRVEEKPKRNLNIKKYWPAVVLVLIIIAAAYVMTNKPNYDIKIAETDHIKGTGQIEIVEFSDFQCPACGAAYAEIKKSFSQYESKVKFVYKHFPLIQIHKFAWKAAEASECAADQNRFWEYHDKLFENQNVLDVPSLKKYASEISLNTDDFNKCLDSGVMGSRVSKGLEEGQSWQVQGTPTFIINGKKCEEGAFCIQIDSLKQSLGI